MTKEESNQNAYENLLIKKMSENDKKITELSEESLVSTRKRSRPKGKPVRSKHSIVRGMLEAADERHKKQFPNFERNEIKLLNAIVVIQKLWRQKKVKELIR